MSISLWFHVLQHARLPCPSLSFRVWSNLCPFSQWCHPIIPSSVAPFSSHPQSFPESGSFPMSGLFTWGGQSDLQHPVNIQGWLPLRLTSLISLLSRGLSRVLSNTTIWKHQSIFGPQPSLSSSSYLCTWLLEKLYLWLFFSLLFRIRMKLQKSTFSSFLKLVPMCCMVPHFVQGLVF